MLKAILFDMDGVLIDSETEYTRQQLRIGRELGVEFDAPGLKKYAGVSVPDTWAGIVKDYGLDADSDELAELETKRMDEHYESGDLHPIGGSIELLKKCLEAGLKVAIATSTDKNNAQKVARRLELEQKIGALSCGCMAKNCKPEPDIFLNAADMLGVKPHECLVIEDSHSGLLAAKKAGMAAVLLAPGGAKFDTSPADMIVKSCSEMDIDELNEIHLGALGG